MSIRWEERPGSRQVTGGSQASRVDLYYLAGTADQATAYALAISYSSPFAEAAGQILYRQDVKITHEGHTLWYVEIPYARNTQEPLTWRVTSATTGRSQRVFQSKQTTVYGPANAPDHKGAIDVVNGEVRGAEIVLPSTRFTYEVTWPQGMVTEQFMIAAGAQVGKYNLNPWHGMKAGEALFAGHSVEQGSNQKTTMRYEIDYSPNLENATIAGINNINKKGWDLAWEYRQDKIDQQQPVKPAVWIYVERVYESVDFASVLGF
jgi:hypothetical protein